MDMQATVKKYGVSLLIGIAILIVSYILYAYVSNLHSRLSSTEKALQAEKDKPPVIKTETKTVTQLAYVPKETVIYRDAATGKETTGLEKTDVELTVSPPSVYMRYNGKEFEMAGIPGETSKFEQGKLTGEVTTATTIDVTDMVDKEVERRMEANRKHISLGGYVTNKGAALSLGLINKDLEYKAIATVPDYQKFFGVGIEKKF
ncbi:hypothetical protein [Propionispora vibrioides]|uniref:Uncharacterized protein n=1 Tax=Propionispora vibrioides TaxID=112903 RepID=A0A1H8U5X8_9FIRM|nr:hypothetical protein [Propionispora vibrioides]SEO98058.1 hypothetical protein SAMN04490178_10827 [Propionispora vibrioides]